MSAEELKTIRVPGLLSLFLSRLDEEYNKSLQRISPHSIDYVMRLRDEIKLVELLTIFQRYYNRVGSKTDAAMLAELRVEHLYYHHDSIVMMQVKQATEAAAGSKAKDGDDQEMTTPSPPAGEDAKEDVNWPEKYRIFAPAFTNMDRIGRRRVPCSVTFTTMLSMIGSLRRGICCS